MTRILSAIVVFAALALAPLLSIAAGAPNATLNTPGMDHGLSSKRIARQLSIALETVKSHANRAVYRASELGLI